MNDRLDAARHSLRSWARAVGVLSALAGVAVVALAQNRATVRNGDYIVAVVNQELVTAGEVDQRVQRAQQMGARGGARVPPIDELRRLALDSLIEDRVIVTHARDSGVKIDDPEIDRAVQGVAAQNQLTLEQLRDRLRADGIDYARFRANLRDQMMVERVREREVYGRIRITDADIDAVIDEQRRATKAEAELNIAQILVTVADGADEATITARRARAEAALARVRGGEPFDAVARELSEDGNRQNGGEIGLRPLSRLPDLFVESTRTLGSGQIGPTLVRSGAGFHVLKVVERRDPSALRVTQTRARHILLRTSPQVTPEVAGRRLAEYRRQIESGARSFEDVARQHSEDGSAAGGGDLGWFNPGAMVPEFEEAMNRLSAGGLSAPVASRFGVHLIQVMERREVAVDMKQLRDQARGVLRERKFEEAYLEWSKDLRNRAYVEMREPPL
jgi:peptidyl-prolyl cis-trans isomerase SurA